MPREVGRERRLSLVATAVCGALLSLACSGGGGGGGGGGGTETLDSSPSSGSATSTLTFAWDPAFGPVAGYAVWVQRDGPFAVEKEVVSSRVTVEGEVGSRVRLVVVPFDASGATGPSSPISPWIFFPDPDSSDGASSPGSDASEGEDAADGSPPGGDSGSSDGGSDSDGADPDPGSDPDPSDPPAEEPDDLPALADLAGAVLWEAGDALRVTSVSAETLALFGRPWSGARLVPDGVADLDRDGVADLLWTDDGGALAYTPGAELASGTPPVVELATLEAGERVIGAGDLDGDGQDDLLVRRGDVVDAWFVLPDGSVEISELGSAVGATLAGVDDLDGDGSDDVVWSTGGGAATLWLMAQGGVSAAVDVVLGGQLEVLAVGDLDGDGVAELALRAPLGALLLARPLVPALETTGITDAGGWRRLGAADLDEDGDDEIVLAVGGSLRVLGFPGDTAIPAEPGSLWTPVTLLP